jgi:PHD/YefM family antitoxin component YafN of YafNO toxin-antitoxin module
MKFSTQVKPPSYLESHATRIAKDLAENRAPMLITENGEAKLMALDVTSYEEQQQTVALLRIFAMGNREIENGQFRSEADVFTEVGF